jgi:hypothetical protein
MADELVGIPYTQAFQQDGEGQWGLFLLAGDRQDNATWASYRYREGMNSMQLRFVSSMETIPQGHDGPRDLSFDDPHLLEEVSLFAGMVAGVTRPYSADFSRIPPTPENARMILEEVIARHTAGLEERRPVSAPETHGALEKMPRYSVQIGLAMGQLTRLNWQIQREQRWKISRKAWAAQDRLPSMQKAVKGKLDLIWDAILDGLWHRSRRDPQRRAEDGAAVRQMLSEIDATVLPALQIFGDPEMATLPVSDDRLASRVMDYDTKPRRLLRRVKALATCSDRGAALMLGALGAHLRHGFSPRGDAADLKMYPVLLGPVLRRLEEMLPQVETNRITRRRDPEAKALEDEAEHYAGCLFSGLFIPIHDLIGFRRFSEKQMAAPSVKGWVSDPWKVVGLAARVFPRSLKGEEDGDLRVRYFVGSALATGDIFELNRVNAEGAGISLWDLYGGVLKADRYRFDKGQHRSLSQDKRILLDEIGQFLLRRGTEALRHSSAVESTLVGTGLEETPWAEEERVHFYDGYVDSTGRVADDAWIQANLVQPGRRSAIAPISAGLEEGTRIFIHPEVGPLQFYRVEVEILPPQPDLARAFLKNRGLADSDLIVLPSSITKGTETGWRPPGSIASIVVIPTLEELTSEQIEAMRAIAQRLEGRILRVGLEEMVQATVEEVTYVSTQY